MAQLEDTTFDSKPRLYKSFTAIDTDGDGFISYKDFEKHLADNKIHASQDEILCLMHNVLDPSKKGYIDFTHFQEKFGPRMSRQIEVEENELHT